jgi:hypothetical protein
VYSHLQNLIVSYEEGDQELVSQFYNLWDLIDSTNAIKGACLIMDNIHGLDHLIFISLGRVKSIQGKDSYKWIHI